ncbi:MAG TPA: metallophosphoesterase [Drouetiella sp.]
MNKKTLGIAAGSFLLTGLGVYMYASRVEARNYKLETVRITTYGGGGDGPNSASAGKNPGDVDATKKIFRILHLSDTHLAEPESHKLRFLEEVTDGDFDLIVLTGDVFENYTGLKYAGALLSRQPKLGAYAVLGNHDYYNYKYWNKIVGRINRKWRHPMEYRDVQPMIKALRNSGYDVLLNESRTHSEGVHIVGVDYPGIESAEMNRLVAEAPDGFLKLALFHMPRKLYQFVDAGVDLAVGGHTHGGQIRVPGVGALITDSELSRAEVSGLVYRGKTTFHISRGLSADPRSNFRLFCPPAATILEVVHKPYAVHPEHDVELAETATV